MEKNIIVKCALALYITCTFALFAMTCYYANALAETTPHMETAAAFLG
ncbi:hypothetical protein IKA92_01440 [bacterium]|nr:hypothetical protein [bacterium]